MHIGTQAVFLPLSGWSIPTARAYPLSEVVCPHSGVLIYCILLCAQRSAYYSTQAICACVLEGGGWVIEFIRTTADPLCLSRSHSHFRNMCQMDGEAKNKSF